MATQLERRTGTQQAIIDATIALYLEQTGIDPSLDAVAERAGVAKSTVLYHFQSRLGLLREVSVRLYHEMGDRLGPLDQYEDAPAFVRAFLNDGRNPTTKVFQQVGDQLRYAAPELGIGRGLQALMGVLEELGVTDGILVKASATQMMARQVTFGQVDPTIVDAFVDELFEVSVADRRGRG